MEFDEIGQGAVVALSEINFLNGQVSVGHAATFIGCHHQYVEQNPL